MAGKNAYSYTEDGTFMVISGEESFRRFFGGAHQSHSSKIHPPKIGCKSKLWWYKFSKPEVNIFPVTPPKKKGGKRAQIHFLGFLIFGANFLQPRLHIPNTRLLWSTEQGALAFNACPQSFAAKIL